MLGGRTMMALILSLTVAMLPVGGVSKATAGPAGQVASGVMSKEMTMASGLVGGTDCCADQTKATPCDQSRDQCSIAFCAFSPAGAIHTAVLHVDSPISPGQLLPIPLDQVASWHSNSPPFRPPRV